MFQNVSNDSALGYEQSQEQRVKILHIEDSPADQTLARLSLKRGQLPCLLTTVDSLQATEAALQVQNFDLILADYRLRGHRTGHEAIAAIRERTSQALPAIIITGDTAADQLRNVHAGGTALLHKPVVPGELHSAIGALLRGSEWYLVQQ